MNKRIKRLFIIMMVFMVTLGSLLSVRGMFVIAADSDVIRNDETGIPDKVLYQMILKALGKTADSSFTEEDAQKVEELSQDIYGGPGDLHRKEKDQVVSLQGIEKLINLRRLYLGKNKITDLKPLESLKKLDGLNLMYSYSITSIEGIRNLTWLEDLKLPPTVTDLSPVEGMKKLVGLDAANSGIRTLPDLTGHTKLTGHDGAGHDTSLVGNNLTEKELIAKLPKQLVGDGEWLKMTIDLQEYNVKKMKKTLKVTSPKKVTKITSKTKKIIGKAAKNVCVELCYGSGEPGVGKLIKGAKVDKNGVFKLKNLKLKNYKKKKLYLVSSYVNRFYCMDDPYVMKTITFRLKK